MPFYFHVEQPFASLFFNIQGLSIHVHGVHVLSNPVFFVCFFFRFVFYATYVQDTFRTCLNDHVSFAQQNYHTNTTCNYWLLYYVMKCTCFGARSHSLVT